MSPTEEILDKVGLFLCSVIVLGNLLILVAGFVNRDLRSKTPVLIQSLAVADLFVGVAFMAAFSIALSRQNLPSMVVDALYVGIEWVSYCSVMHLVCIAADRFISVLSPLRYPMFESRMNSVMLAACWILALVTAVISRMLPLHRLMKEIIHVVTYSATGLMFFGCYGYIGFIARKHRLRIQSQIPQQQTPMQNRATQVLMTVVGVCALLWGPYIGLMLYYLVHDEARLKVLEKVLVLPAIANSGVNIFIYSFMKKRFRDTLFELLPCGNHSSERRRGGVWVVQRTTQPPST
ncbi:hypothetical protein CAPTEDRAFT_187200 [Capitella teleta]|uniref:G-protein coupled receptors family 1 profile domain-containing protein n=1 Tax=Capitella teleta TaxID=283909 RepID=R7VG04_CAPTE|nr:hypothetical protein CAPTEDRAFT_187200 [Capitella teleta]|eukprot:ELU15216.1 hypothetical protein CAPTEDRAFT_187200 [Capitella teleta]